MATAIFQNDGSNITGFSGGVSVDKGFTRASTPKVHTMTFGDGYEHRLADGINNTPQTFNLSFATRPKAEIDDIVDFLEGKGAVTPFDYVVSDTNSGGERTVKVVCSEWSQTWAYDDYYSLTATFRRVYES